MEKMMVTINMNVGELYPKVEDIMSTGFVSFGAYLLTLAPLPIPNQIPHTISWFDIILLSVDTECHAQDTWRQFTVKCTAQYREQCI